MVIQGSALPTSRRKRLRYSQAFAVFIGAGTASRDDQRTFYGSQTGLRNTKFAFLISQSARQACATPISPSPDNTIYCLEKALSQRMAVRNTNHGDLCRWHTGRRMLPFNGAALATRHDEFAIAYTKSELVEKIRTFLDKNYLERTSKADFAFAQAHILISTEQGGVRKIKLLNQSGHFISPIRFLLGCLPPLLIGEPRPTSCTIFCIRI